jgi:hypothetical protein
MLKPTVMYGCETGSTTEKDEIILNTWERKIFKKMYGPVTEQEVWKTELPKNLWGLYKSPDLVANCGVYSCCCAAGK